MKSIFTFITGSFKFINRDDGRKTIRFKENSNIFLKDTIHSIGFETMHSRDRSHGMIFRELNKSRLSIRDSDLTIVKLKRDILFKIMMAVITDKSMIIDNQNDFKKVEREIGKIDRSDTLGSMARNGIEMRASGKTELRNRIDIHDIIYLFDKEIGIPEKDRNKTMKRII